MPEFQTAKLDPRNLVMLREVAKNDGELTVRPDDDLQRQCVLAACGCLGDMGYVNWVEVGPDEINVALTASGWSAANV